MFNSFRSKKRQEQTANRAAGKTVPVIAKAFMKMQTAWAKWMSEEEKKMTLRQKKIAFAAFCIIMSILPCSIVYNGFFKKQATAPTWLKTPSVTLPEDTRLPDSLNLDYLKELYKKRNFKVQIDSTHN